MLAVLAAGTAGCGGGAAISAADASIDEPFETEAPSYCSVQCGEVSAASAPDVGLVVQCPSGQFCGETGGVPGFICCTPHERDLGTCVPGFPAPGSGCPVMATDGGSTDSGGADAGSQCLGAGGVYTPPPECYGTDDTQCCVQGGTGPATCVGGQWMCGTAMPSGCNGTPCAQDAGDGG